VKRVFAVFGMIHSKPCLFHASNYQRGNLLIVFNYQNSHLIAEAKLLSS
jgi:hypothetical protein